MKKNESIEYVFIMLYLGLMFGTFVLSCKVYVLVRDQQKVVSPIQKEPFKIQVEYTLPKGAK